MQSGWSRVVEPFLGSFTPQFEIAGRCIDLVVSAKSTWRIRSIWNTEIQSCKFASWNRYNDVWYVCQQQLINSKLQPCGWVMSVTWSFSELNRGYFTTKVNNYQSEDRVIDLCLFVVCLLLNGFLIPQPSKDLIWSSDELQFRSLQNPFTIILPD